ncbi:MAG: hypothetical protein ACYDCN_09960 [Bacteroidia bacterium]
MDETLFEKLKKIEKESPAFFSLSKKSLVNYISVKTSPKGDVLYKSRLVLNSGLPKEIAEKVEIVLSE